MYSETNLLKLEQEYNQLEKKYVDIMLNLSYIASTLTNTEAQEYILQGAGRRLRIIKWCIHSIYAMFPPDQKIALTDDEAAQLCIPTHALMINQAGFSDNLAWAFVKEKNVELKYTDVGLHLPKTKELLSASFRQYLEGDLADWSKKYLKKYRDSLAHRIPLYIPPGVTPEEKRIPVPVFRGSVNSDQLVNLHPQLLADFNTIGQLTEKFIEFEFPKAAKLALVVSAL